MKQLNRFEMAAVKRTAQNTKTLVKNKAKLNIKIHELASQMMEIDAQIESWEKPLIDKWGYDSAHIIEMGGNIPDIEEENKEEVESSNN